MSSLERVGFSNYSLYLYYFPYTTVNQTVFEGPFTIFPIILRFFFGLTEFPSGLFDLFLGLFDKTLEALSDLEFYLFLESIFAYL